MKAGIQSLFCFFIVLAWAGMAYAVPVKFLPAVTPADVTCDNAVNEKALLADLQNWVKDCNTELAKFEKMQEKEIIQSLLNMDEATPFANLLETESKNTLDELAEPVLDGWFKPEDTVKLSPAKQKVLSLLSRYGLVPESEEGMSFLVLDNAFFYKQIELSPEAKVFVDVITSQPLSSEAFMREDGILNYGQDVFAKWAVSLEKFLRTNPENPYAPYALQRYQLWMDYMLFYNLTDADGVLSNWQWQKNFLRDIANEYPDSFTAGLIKEFTDSIEVNGLRDEKALKQTIRKRIDTEFAFAASKQNNNVNDSPQIQYYEGKGFINANIPVTIWFDNKNGLVSGEIIYTKTKAQTPIRILGYIKENNSIELREMLPSGDVSGTIVGKFVRGTITGIWQGRSKMIEKQNGEYEYKEGKEFPLKITAAERIHSPYKWDFDSKKASGLYAYSLWENGDNGTVNLQIKDNGTVEYRIIGLTGAPGYRTACFPEDALSGETAAAILKDNIIPIDVDENCAIELTLYSDFLVSRYAEGKYCLYHVGNGATAEGLFLKTK